MMILLKQEFKRDPPEAKRQTRLITLSFETAVVLQLADYLSKKDTLL